MSADELYIRRAVLADAAAIVAFNQTMALETEDKTLPDAIISAGVAGLLAQPDYGFYLVAEADGVVIGSLMVTYEWSDWRNGLLWWIQSVYVTAAWRRRGVYRALYNAVKAQAAQTGQVRGFRLYVEKDNAPAQHTYRALGMTETDYRLFEEILPPCH